MTWTSTIFFLGYVLCFSVGVAGMLWWHKRQRKTRLPFGEDLKLARNPGETQLRLVRKFEEDAIAYLIWAASVPAVIGLLLFTAATKLPATLIIPGVVAALVAFAASFILAARWYSGRARESFDRYLGYFGERVVAENLEPLKRAGWFVFHDIPAQNNGTPFNLDHVAVGPQGVFAIETKTRRKGNARPGFDDHKVYYDGRALIWPWGEDNHGLEQAERNAVWLAESLKKETGERVHVSPILTLPGWWVELKPSRESRMARVINPKGLPKVLSNGPAVLNERQVEAIAARLDARCRDVVY
jgi:uncharacterized membrane protein (DUF485 family)